MLLRTTECAHRKRQIKNGGQLQKNVDPPGPSFRKAVTLRNRWQGDLDRLAHLLRRAILHAGSAMLDYDFEYFCFIMQ